jgi:hypothetical protein
MNVGLGPVAAQFLFWKYMFRIFGIVSLQLISLFICVGSRCRGRGKYYARYFDQKLQRRYSGHHSAHAVP